ncbi:hypothetical protein [Variovorax sp. tm]|uniref:hypothetical protein n=1 Tax=Variovorax atrisoli TaxID=3394203 RepID=UPI003A7FBECB
MTYLVALRRVLFSIVAFAALLLVAPITAFSQTINTTPVNVPGLCNSVSFHQIPGNGNYFVGRRLLTTTDGCSGSNWTLSLFQMDWSSHTLNRIRDVISLPVALTDQNATITSAYDPTVMSFNGELWMSFECVDTGASSGGVSACLAPISSTTFDVDTSRMTVAVSAIQQTAFNDGYSASVPKLFQFGGTPYMYWSVSHFVQSADGPLLSDTTTRGAMLAQESSGLRRLWVNGSLGARISTLNSQFTTEVFGLTSGQNLLDGTADSFDIKVVNGKVLLTTAVGGKGCGTPTSPAYGCYRLQIRSSTTPLGNGIFNGSIATTALPFNPHEYSKFITDPNGSSFVIGQYLQVQGGGTPAPANTIPNGMSMFPIDLNALQFSATDSTPAPAPAHAGEFFYTAFDTLRQFQTGCKQGSPRPNQNSGECAAAVSRYCRSQGYEAGGVLVENAGNIAAVACVTSSKSSMVQTTIPALTAYQATCTSNNMYSGDCASAINAFCSAAGYGGGGYGPMEISGSNVALSCMGDQIATHVATTFTALSAQSACDGSWPGTGSCHSAVHRSCQALGYASGYGVTDYSQDNVIMGCIKKNISN